MKNYSLYKINNYNCLYQIYKLGYIECGSNIIFVLRPDILDELSESFKQKYRIIQLDLQELYKILEFYYSEHYLYLAHNYLTILLPNASARNIKYKSVLTLLLLLMLILLTYSNNVFHLCNAVIYFGHNGFKSYLLAIVNVQDNKILNNHSPSHYPMYSILIPLYNEIAHLTQAIKAVRRLNYPKHKLDIKIIVEEDDIMLIRSLVVLNLPDYFHIIKTPQSQIRTKPKALNYAINYVIGEYIVVYDAEDIPEPNQILKALDMFNKMPKEYICMQAKLAFYNASENLLTKLFNIEYILWFNYLLSGMSKLNLPIPLGGTSNHFKTFALYRVGLWDAYNVTEDADLGLRLYISGYKTALIDSWTLEESPTDIVAWIKQRSRWIKGFIQTFCVYCKRRFIFQELPQNYKIDITAIMFIGFAAYSFFLQSILVIFFWIQLNSYVKIIWSLNITYGLIYSVASGIIVINNSESYDKLIDNHKIIHKILFFKKYLILILWPFYFFLHTIATYVAIFDLFTTPFFWHKTKHNVSKIKTH